MRRSTTLPLVEGKSATRSFSASNVALYSFLSLLALISFVPFLIMLINATRSDAEIFSSVSLLPGSSLLENIRTASERVNLGRGFLNSVLVSSSATIFSVYFSAVVAYGFTAYKFKGRRFLFSIVLVSMTFPMQLTFIGYFEMVRAYNLLDSYLPLILPAIANAGSVFFLRQYALQLFNISITESARIDGAGEFLIFNRIVLPTLVPAMATIGIFTFIYQWNVFLQPFLILKSRELFTLPLMIRTIQFSVQYSPQYGATYFAIALSVLPMLIVFFTFSKRIISGLSSGSVKG